MSHPLDSHHEYSPAVEIKPPRRPWLERVLRPDRPGVNVVLFLLTFVSTFLTGYLPENNIAHGLWYSTGIIAILLFHEMGHYLMCVRHGIRATLPYFLPFPFSPFGTLGAVIRMDARMPDRRVLFDVGVAGPLAGLLITIPAIYFGLKMSHVVPVNDISGGLTLGDSWLFRWISSLAIGEVPDNMDTLLHPLAYAGWTGLFVTALNLLPIGQLDGGHILYALMGERVQQVFTINMAFFALICILQYSGWVLLIVLLLWFGYRHPPTQNADTPLDTKRQLLAYLTFVIFLVSFTPVPFKF